MKLQGNDNTDMLLSPSWDDKLTIPPTDTDLVKLRWRSLTLQNNPTAHTSPTYLTSRAAKIHPLTTSLCTAFDPWVNTSHSSQSREQSLRQIMHNAADVGVMIFAQPRRVEFRWDVMECGDQCRERKMVVLPAFVQLTDEEGVRIEGGMVLVNALILDLEGAEG